MEPPKLSLSRSLRKLIRHKGSKEPVDLKSLGEYQYTPLTNAREIRILMLDPGADDDIVSCTLQHVSLDAPESFKALSYTWGNVSERTTVKCGDGMLSIALNLNDAFRRLRHRYSKRALWADAICINQNDLDERAEQVKLMADIYSKAVSTLIWLGEDAKDVEEAFHHIRWIRERFPTYSWIEAAGLPGTFPNRYCTPLLAPERTEFLLQVNWEPIQRLLQRAWFQRKWVIQEVVKGRKPQVICGNSILDWDTLEDAFMYTKLFGSKNAKGATAGASNDSIMGFNNVTLIGLAKVECAEKTQTLSSLLYTTRFFACTDPRDHLIALVGLACDIDHDGPGTYSLQADYKLPPAKLFRQYVLWDIFVKGSLYCFSSGCNQQTTSPSWVPDFTSRNEQLSTSRQHMSFRASGDSKLNAAISEDGLVLSLVGKVVDELCAMTTTHLPWDLPDYDVQRWAQESKALALRGSESTSNSLVPRRLEALCQCLLWDSSIDISNSKSLLANFRTFVDLLAAPLRERDTAWESSYQNITAEIVVNFPTFSAGRHFAETTGGRLASVPKGSKVGDKVCVLYGGDLPYVIRPVGRGTFTLVGDCYVYELMNREAMDMVDIATEEIHLI